MLKAMKPHSTLPSLSASAMLFCASLDAAPIIDWHIFKSAPATTLSGQGTSSPVWGSTSATAATATLDNTATAGVAGQTENWLGYRFGVKSGTGTGSAWSIRERGAGADLNPMANAQSVSLAAPTGDQLLWSGAVNGVGGALY